ncbi:MAG: very short patch repair endonuclease [Deltaproteobacteria bacterium]|nr:very short patch repair endonuclease [Deltaproteobacteria bacterium]
MGGNPLKMDSVSAKERSRIMRNVKARGNKSTELKLIKLFKDYGLTGWRRNYLVIGKPDFVFLTSRLAIFVDGCFWHGCKDHCRIPATNKDYWVDKVNRNKKRDGIINATFRTRNWRVVRIWEHELEKGNYKKSLNKIKNIVQPIIPPDG